MSNSSSKSPNSGDQDDKLKERARLALLSLTLNKLCKWRTFFASWQFGTRSDQDPEAAAVRDHREATLILRAEMNALVTLLMETGLLNPGQYQQVVIDEANKLDAKLAKQYPGFTTTDWGLSIKMPEALETMKRMNFKP